METRQAGRNGAERAGEGVSCGTVRKGWEPFSFQGRGDIGVLVLHGFTGSTSSVIHWARRLAEAGFHVEGPRLTGHGTHWRDMNRLSWRDWVQDVETGYDRLRRRAGRCVVAGLSFGGALALYLAEVHPELRGVVAVNNVIRIDSILGPFLPLLRRLVSSSRGVSNDIKDPREREICYDRTPTGGAHEMKKALDVIRRDLGCITQPLLVMKSREDHILPAHHAQIVYDGVASQEKEFVWLDNSYHVATQDFDRDIVADRTIAFVRRYA